MASLALNTTVFVYIDSDGTVTHVFKLLMSLLGASQVSAIVGKGRSGRKRKSEIESSTASSSVDAAAADESSIAG